MTQEYIDALKTFLQTYQSDEALKPYRKFVNVYVPHPEDIESIYAGVYELKNLEVKPSAYGKGNMAEFSVGQTSFRIWGDAEKYIQDLAAV